MAMLLSSALFMTVRRLQPSLPHSMGEGVQDRRTSPLHFNNILLQGLHKRDHLATLRWWNFKCIQGRIGMA